MCRETSNLSVPIIFPLLFWLNCWMNNSMPNTIINIHFIASHTNNLLGGVRFLTWGPQKSTMVFCSPSKLTPVSFTIISSFLFFTFVVEVHVILFFSSLGSHPLCSSSQLFIRLVNWEPALFGIPETLYRCIWVLLKGSLLSSLEQLDRSSGKTPELVIWGWRRVGVRGRVRVNEGREERPQLHMKSFRPKQMDSIVEQETGHFGQFSVD